MEQSKLQSEIQTGQSKIKQSLIQKARLLSETLRVTEGRRTESQGDESLV